MKRTLLSALVVLALGSAATASHAGGTLAGGRLTLSGGTDIKVTLGPLAGQATVFGVAGVADGTVYNGVAAIAVVTGTADDKIQIDGDLANDLDLTLATSTGSDEIKLDFKVPASVASATVRVDAATSTGNDKLEWKVDSGAQALTLVLTGDFSTGNDEVILNVESDVPSESLALNLAPSLSTGDDKLDVTLKSLARNVSLSAAPQGSTGNDTVKIVLDQGVPATVTTSLAVVLDTGTDTAEVVLKGTGLTHVVNGFVSAGTDNDAVKIELEGNATGSLLVDASTGDDSAELVVKGAYTGSVQLLGSTGNDSLKVLVDGPFAGSAVIDGSTGSDSCSGPAGASIRNCE